MNSIQKTIEMLEEIEKDLEEKEDKQSYMGEVEALIESYRAPTGDLQKKFLARKPTLGNNRLSEPVNNNTDKCGDIL